MADVFLSYKREDQKIAREVATDLEAEGFSVFFDVRIEVGDAWDERIERELNAAKAVVVLWSPKSRDSKWVKREAREAMARDILCPALIAACKIPLEFTDVQTADLLDHHAGDLDHAGWRRLCDGVGRCVRGEGQPSSTSASAPVRGERNRNPSRRVVIAGAAGVTAVAAGGGGYYFWRQSEDHDNVETMWVAARDANTRLDLHSFLHRFPTTPQAAKARAALARLPFSVSQTAVLSGHQSVVEDVAFVANGTRVVSMSWDQTVRLWAADRHRADDRRLIQQLPLRVITGGALSADEGKIATAGFDRDGQLIKIMMLMTGDTVSTIRAHRQFISSLSFSADGNSVLSASHDGTACTWDVASGNLQASFGGAWGALEDASFSPSGSHVVLACVDGTARVVSVGTGAAELTLTGHQNRVMSAIFSPDGRQIVTTSSDGTTRIWNSRTGEPVAVLGGHSNTVWNSKFNRDGTLLVTASFDATARIWDSYLWTQLAVLEGHTNQVRSACFSFDDRCIATGSGDRTGRLWEVTASPPPPPVTP